MRKGVGAVAGVEAERERGLSALGTTRSTYLISILAMRATWRPPSKGVAIDLPPRCIVSPTG